VKPHDHDRYRIGRSVEIILQCGGRTDRQTERQTDGHDRRFVVLMRGKKKLDSYLRRRRFFTLEFRVEFSGADQ